MENLLPLISIIMPCYNSAPYIEKAISSVLRQAYKNIELIIIDDGSSDKSGSILERLVTSNNQIIRILHQDHKGPYPARNLGLKEAKGELIAFLDSDDWWREDCLMKLHDAIHRNNADLSYCGWQNIGKPEAESKPYIPPKYEDEEIVQLFLESCPWPIHAALIRREVVNAVGGFSVRRFSSMDYDFWLKILGHTRNIVRVPEVMSFYRWHESGQISSNKWRQVIDALHVRKDFVTKHPDLVQHLSHVRLRTVLDGQLLTEAYSAFWKRDLQTAQRLFRYAFIHGIWKTTDLKYVALSLLPGFLYKLTVNMFSQAGTGKSA